MMLSIGCIQSRQCNTNGCPTGIATQDQKLVKGLVIDRKKIRVAQYHDATTHSFMELVGSMGITDPSCLNPAHIVRRLGPGKIKHYNEIYEYLEPGDLLKSKIPESFACHWKMADPNKF